jgi:hypothetical protein
VKVKKKGIADLTKPGSLAAIYSVEESIAEKPVPVIKVRDHVT